MGRLLEDMSRQMQKKVDQKLEDPLKILVHSTHDTCLAALCSTLDVFDEKRVCFLCWLGTSDSVLYSWPAFTASITFELFKKREEKNRRPYFQSLLSSLTSYGTTRDQSDHCTALFTTLSTPR